MTGDPTPTIRVFNPAAEGYTESEIPRDISDLYKALRLLRQEDGGIISRFKDCLKTEVALRSFELCGGYNIGLKENGWYASLDEVYSYDKERDNLSPALSILVVCLAAANGVYPDLGCMKNNDTTLFVGSRTGKYKPVVLTHKPETNKAMDVTRAVILVTPGKVSRFCGSYDLTDDKYHRADGSILGKVDDYLYKLGKGVL